MGCIAAGVVAAAAAIGSAVVQGDASRKAANARKDALNQMEKISPNAEQDLALQRDKQHITDQLELQKSADPTTAAIREKGLQSYLDSLSGKSSNDKVIDQGVANMAAEGLNADPRVTAIKDKLLADAKAELDKGASLSPDFQAETVRAGLTSAGQAGWAPSAQGGAGRTAGKLLGSAGIQLEQLRKQNATQAVGTATDLATARSNILGRIIGTAGTVQQARDTRAAGGVSLAQSMMPAAGLSGADMVNLDMARINQQNKIQQGLGEANAAKATAQGQMYSGIIGGVASGVTAGMGGGGGGYSNMFGSLLSSSSSPSFGGSAANQTGAFDTIQAPPGGWKY